MNSALQKAAERAHEQLEARVGAAAREVKKQQKIIKDIYQEVKNSLEVLDDDTFWLITEKFAEKANSKFVKERYGNAGRIENAASNTAWEFAYGNGFGLEDDDIYTFIAYVKTYKAKVGELPRTVGRLVGDEFTGDSYGDMLDAFPLFGRERFEKAQDGELEGEAEDQYQGEIYVHMNLDDAGLKYFTSALLGAGLNEEELQNYYESD